MPVSLAQFDEIRARATTLDGAYAYVLEPAAIEAASTGSFAMARGSTSSGKSAEAFIVASSRPIRSRRLYRTGAGCFSLPEASS